MVSEIFSAPVWVITKKGIPSQGSIVSRRFPWITASRLTPVNFSVGNLSTTGMRRSSGIKSMQVAVSESINKDKEMSVVFSGQIDGDTGPEKWDIKVLLLVSPNPCKPDRFCNVCGNPYRLYLTYWENKLHSGHPLNRMYAKHVSCIMIISGIYIITQIWATLP